MLNTNYPDLIAGWLFMGPREKFNALAKLRKREKEWAGKEPKAKKPRKKRIYIKKEKIPFNPPPGYYQTNKLSELTGMSITMIKRYKQYGLLREYRAGNLVAYCEYDVIIAHEKGTEKKRELAKEATRKRMQKYEVKNEND